MPPISSKLDLAAVDHCVRFDPADRGPARFKWNGRVLGEGQLETAAHSLARASGAVAIVTGFAVFDGQSYVPETDGPPGALALADILRHHNREVVLISDVLGLPALVAGCAALDLSPALLEFPFEGDVAAPQRQSNDPTMCTDSDAWVHQFLTSELGRRLSHLISIERVGPSHTRESILAQSDDVASLEAFEHDVPPEHRNACHNMRGVVIDAHTAKTHRLFEIVHASKLPITTLGIGDGGNELGMGQFPWTVLRTAIAQGPAGRVACRIATDLTLLAGVSNWGGYGLAAAVDRLYGDAYFLRTWNYEREQQLLNHLVDQARCVDGVSRRHEATVDGLSGEQAAAFWRELASALGQF